jgi:hypothetical protein
MPQRASSTSFKPGQSGNPKGRAKREFEQAYLKKTVASVSLADWVEIVLVAVHQAKQGDDKASKWLGDYLVGTPVQRTEITGNEGGSLVFEVILGSNDQDTPTNGN